MRLTKNEKKTLKLLLKNSKISDSAIAEKLKISSQAVGKIRKKLEKEIIKSYTLEVDYSKLGIKTFAIAISRLTEEGFDKGELEIEKKLLDEPNIIQVYRLPNQSTTHIILYGFKSIEEMDSYFHDYRKIKDLHRYIQNKELYTFSSYGLIKNNPLKLFYQAIDEIENHSKIKIKEIESFKRKIKND